MVESKPSRVCGMMQIWTSTAKLPVFFEIFFEEVENLEQEVTMPSDPVQEGELDNDESNPSKRTTTTTTTNANNTIFIPNKADEKRRTELLVNLWLSEQHPNILC
jgi:hypothetical protein